MGDWEGIIPSEGILTGDRRFPPVEIAEGALTMPTDGRVVRLYVELDNGEREEVGEVLGIERVDGDLVLTGTCSEAFLAAALNPSSSDFEISIPELPDLRRPQ